MLVSVEQAVESLGLPAALESQMEPILVKAIAKAQLRLEAELDTMLDALDHTEVFHLDSELHSGVLMHGLLALRLGCSFVKAAPSPVITASVEWNGTYTEVPVTDFKLNALKGQIFLDKKYDGQYVAVEYSSGFKTPTQTVPALREALLSMLPSLMNAQGGTEPLPNADEKMKLAGTLVTRLKRTNGFGFRPFTVDSTPSA